MYMSMPPQLEILNTSIDLRRQEENSLRTHFQNALEISADITAVNAIVSILRPDLAMTEPVPQRQLDTYPFDHRRAGNFIPRLGGFGDPRYTMQEPWAGGEPELTFVGRLPVTKLGYETYVQLFARGAREQYPVFAEEHNIDPEMALDAFDNSLTRYGAFARMAFIAPELTQAIVRSCVKQSEQPKDLEIYIAYSLASLLVDRNDPEVKGPDDDQVLSR
jgi:hypothetical protein